MKPQMKIAAAAITVFAAMVSLTALAGDLVGSAPSYEPASQQYKGTLRLFGSALKGVVASWAEAYAKLQPNVRFAINPGGSDAAIGSIQHGTADIAVFGRELTLNDYLGFSENHGYNPTEIIVASGGFDVPGSSFGLVVFVNKENPLRGLTMKQLDGIFGSQRTGGYRGYQWIPVERSAQDNIRTWGQLGLGGEWKNKPIQTYGYADGGMAQFFQFEVFAGGDKWNENYRQYVEDGTRILGKELKGSASGILSMLAEIEKNKYGIGFAGFPQWKKVPDVTGIRPVALSKDGGPFVVPTRETMTDRSYPLTRSVYFYINKDPARPLSPMVEDFIKFVLSRDGQEIVEKNGIYLPLPADVAQAGRAKLE
jgi:phosphate transport system substrate-binding protein